ncbi:ubiquitin-like domain-containing protein [Streptomyces sp. NPDC003522]
MSNVHHPRNAYGADGTYVDVHNAETVAHGVPQAREAARRPAHEPTVLAVPPGPPGPALPRRAEGAPYADGSGTGAWAGGGTGRAAHRRRTRDAARADSPMRRLLPLLPLVPQALIVAFLAGGTAAFVAKDKAVELTVDGRPRTLHTFADDVGELLAEEGVRTGAHDMVAPSPGTALADGDEIAVRHARPVRLTLDGRRHEAWTTARTVEEALGQFGVRAQGAHLSVSRSRPVGREGPALDVRTPSSAPAPSATRGRRTAGPGPA